MGIGDGITIIIMKCQGYDDADDTMMIRLMDLGEICYGIACSSCLSDEGAD